MSTVETWEPSALELDRRRYRKQSLRRSSLIAVVSTLLFATVIAIGLDQLAWLGCRQDVVLQRRDRSRILPWSIVKGLWLNIQVLFFASIGVAIFGSLLAVLRSLRGPVFFPAARSLAAAYTDLFRGIPLLIVLYLIGFGLPALGIFPRLPNYVWGTIAIIFTYSAYVSEVLRAGMEAVHPSQRIAARSLGLSATRRPSASWLFLRGCARWFPPS